MLELIQRLLTYKKQEKPKEKTAIEQIRDIATNILNKNTKNKLKVLKKQGFEIMDFKIIDINAYNSKSYENDLKLDLIKLNTFNTNNSTYIFILNYSIPVNNKKEDLIVFKEKNSQKQIEKKDLNIFAYKEDFIIAINTLFNQALKKHETNKFPFSFILIKSPNSEKPIPANNIDYEKIRKIA